MAAKRKRDSRGRFLKKTSRRRAAPRKRRRNPGTAVARPRPRSAAPRKVYRRNTHRSNPRRPRIVKTLIDGVQNAGAAVLGKAAARAIPQQFGFQTTGPMGIAVQAGVAIVVGMVADRVARKQAPFIVAGALMAPIESAIRDFNIPILSEALGAYPLAAYPGLPSLPAGAPSEGVGAYPEDGWAMGSYESSNMAQMY